MPRKLIAFRFSRTGKREFGTKPSSLKKSFCISFSPFFKLQSPLQKNLLLKIPLKCAPVNILFNGALLLLVHIEAVIVVVGTMIDAIDFPWVAGVVVLHFARFAELH